MTATGESIGEIKNVPFLTADVRGEELGKQKELHQSAQIVECGLDEEE
jgi:hypothetical protein